ncbi:hypothetical protein MMC31_008162, partial [Peltigera leucophlebia]|nr:hypothetical protein [Peltigera leucophlebia]
MQKESWPLRSEAIEEKDLPTAIIKQRSSRSSTSGHRASSIGHQAAKPLRSNRREELIERGIKQRPSGIRYQAAEPSRSDRREATVEKRPHRASGIGHQALGIRPQSHREATVKKKSSSETIKKRPAAIRHHQAAEPLRSDRQEATVKKKSSSEAIKKRPAAIRHWALGIGHQALGITSGIEHQRSAMQNKRQSKMPMLYDVS